MSQDSTAYAAELGKLLLSAGIGLLNAGAGSNRIVLNLVRMASAYGYQAHIDLSMRSITVSLHNDAQGDRFLGSRSLSSMPGVNFKMIDEVSRLSWSVADDGIPLERAIEQLEKILHTPHYHRAIVLGMVGLAGASFCFTFGGSLVEMIAAFFATVTGLFLKQELIRRKFNPYLVTYASALLSALVVALCWKSGIDAKFEHALATCILFLIPGVPLINGVIDFMDGYTANGVDRGINASIHAFAIAAGLATILYMFQLYS
jgi:uncharacterized membrane protein YjjP (DUF1212 family)